MSTFQLQKKKFVSRPISPLDLGKVSPRSLPSDAASLPPKKRTPPPGHLTKLLSVIPAALFSRHGDECEAKAGGDSPKDASGHD